MIRFDVLKALHARLQCQGPVISSIAPLRRNRNARQSGLLRIRLQCGRCDSITDQSGTTRLGVSAMLLRAAHSCGPRLLCTGDVVIINAGDEIPPKFETHGSKAA
jgi:hypothetical protein